MRQTLPSTRPDFTICRVSTITYLHVPPGYATRQEKKTRKKSGFISSALPTPSPCTYSTSRTIYTEDNTRRFSLSHDLNDSTLFTHRPTDSSRTLSCYQSTAKRTTRPITYQSLTQSTTNFLPSRQLQVARARIPEKNPPPTLPLTTSLSARLAPSPASARREASTTCQWLFLLIESNSQW